MFLILLLPMALGQTSLRGREVKVTTVAHRPFIMPNNLSSGERWPAKLHRIVHHYHFLRFEGFLVDMMKELSTMLGFTFNIHDNPEKKCCGQNKENIKIILLKVRPTCRRHMERHDWRGNTISYIIYIFHFLPFTQSFVVLIPTLVFIIR